MTNLTDWMITNLLTESQLDVIPPGYTKPLRELVETDSATYTIKVESQEVLDELDGFVATTKYGDQVYTNFKKVTSGTYTGGYEGNINGESVIFLPDEIKIVKREWE